MIYRFEMKHFVSKETFVKATSATPLELDNISSPSLIAKCVSSNLFK